EDDPRQAPLRARRKSIQPAMQRRDLVSLERALAVVAHELSRASVISRLLEVMDRAVDVSARRRALGMSAMQLDDLGRGKELASSRAQELGEERLKAVVSARASADDQACLLERRKELAWRAARDHRLVVLDPL